MKLTEAKIPVLTFEHDAIDHAYPGDRSDDLISLTRVEYSRDGERLSIVSEFAMREDRSAWVEISRAIVEVS